MNAYIPVLGFEVEEDTYELMKSAGESWKTEEKVNPLLITSELPQLE